MLRVGDRVEGRYDLKRDLGRGASGLVFEAEHVFTHRTVALKIVAPDVPLAQRDELRARLVREARALTASRHPGIVDVLDGGFLEDGTPYLVMEKLEGRTLEGLLAARTKLTAGETATVMVQICDALDIVHRAGVVHRDLKPDNLFIVRDRDGQERVKVVDFGTAQLEAGGDGKLSSHGAILGTPAYMAPEQLLAEGDVDSRADVYALGATLVECLTGRLAYEGSYQQVLLQVCGDDTPPNVRGRFPEIPEALARISERALAKTRGERFPSVVDLARAIHEAVPGAPSHTTFLGPPPLPRFAAAVAAKDADAAQRRRAARAPYGTPVHVVLAQGSIDGRSEDISEGGLLVITRHPCEPNQRATVRFALPIEGHVASCQADIRWVRAARPGATDGARAIGLEFVEPSAAIRGSIKRYVEAMGGRAQT
jgi:serine/threonine-protein kinase